MCVCVCVFVFVCFILHGRMCDVLCIRTKIMCT